MRVAVYAALLPAGFILAAVLQRSFLPGPPAQHIDFAQPLPVATNWHAFGLSIGGAVIAGLAVAGVGYAALVRGALRGSRLPLALIVAIAIVALIAAAFVPVLLSSDVYAYAVYGALAAAGSNPYAHVALPTEPPLYTAAIFQWGNPIPACVYGPLFVEISRMLVTWFAPIGVIAQLDALRILAALALVACGPLTYAALSWFPSEQRIAGAAIVVLNPVAIWVAAEGHNDTLMLAFALAGFALLRRAPFAGACIVALAGLIKAPALAAAFAPALALRDRARAIVLGAATGTALVALAYLPFLSGIRSALRAHPGSAAAASLYAISPLAAAALALLVGVAGWRRIRRADLEGWCWIGIAIWLLIPNPYPWYGLWFLPLAALAPRSRGALVIILLSFTTALRYIPDAAAMPAPALNALLALIVFSPLLLLIQPKRYLQPE